MAQAKHVKHLSAEEQRRAVHEALAKFGRKGRMTPPKQGWQEKKKVHQ